jgi:hypothetical protein
VYGAAGAYGSDDDDVVNPLERAAVDDALRGVPLSAYYDIFASHEPVATEQAAHDLPGQVRQLNSGHTHQQNKQSEIQRADQPITLVEGSTGAGGLRDVDDTQRRPIEFSIESVAANCQFTKIVRFELSGAAPTAGDVATGGGRNVTATTLYLVPQDIDENRFCTVAEGIGTPEPVG